MPRALKVYRTPIGFHDAYVAATTQKAALEAWGSDHNLFARGVAEVVTDEALTREPLATPGRVIKRLRGTTAEQLAALPSDKRAAKRSKPVSEVRETKRRSRPKPSRTDLTKAEAALDFARRAYAKKRDDLRQQEAVLAKKRHQLDKDQAAGIASLEAARDDADAAYKAAIAGWEG